MPDKSLHKFNKFVFRKNLIEWYEENKRTLPWRETKDPYAIWVSEIMLQQTKVDTVLSYYDKFMNRFPTVYDLAAADEQEVLKAWEGLGYYSRARNLHAAAKEVVEKFDGKIPDTPEKLSTLKGIGPYTKGAIASIAFELPEPAVDGNVMRVLSRVLLIEDNISDNRTRKRFEMIVRELICEDNPSSFNQGLMDLGAIICTPTSPACLLCPVQNVCRAFEEGKTDELPIKLKRKKQKVKKYYVIILYDEDGKVAIEQRPNEGLLANMWQFLMVETSLIRKKEIAESILEKYGFDIVLEEKIGEVQHVFTHLIWDLQVWKANCLTKQKQKSDVKFLSVEELEQFPFPVSHLKIKEMMKLPLNTNAR